MMIHVNNTFPGYKARRILFVVLVIVFVILFCSHSCGDRDMVKNPEKETELSNDTQLNSKPIAGNLLELDKFLAQEGKTWRSLKLMSTTPYFLIMQEERIDNEQHEDTEATTEIVEETTVEATRPNTLYYVQDDIYRKDLPVEYQDYLYDMCIKYDIEEHYELLLAQMYHESGFRTDVISETNDYGLMQINISNHEWLGQKLGNNNFLDPYNNIEAGVYMMSYGLKKYNDVEKALVCYNKGESAVKNGTYSTKYSKGVLEDMLLLVELNK